MGSDPRTQSRMLVKRVFKWHITKVGDVTVTREECAGEEAKDFRYRRRKSPTKSGHHSGQNSM